MYIFGLYSFILYFASLSYHRNPLLFSGTAIVASESCQKQVTSTAVQYELSECAPASPIHNPQQDTPGSEIKSHYLLRTKCTLFPGFVTQYIHETPLKMDALLNITQNFKSGLWPIMIGVCFFSSSPSCYEKAVECFVKTSKYMNIWSFPKQIMYTGAVHSTTFIFTFTKLT